MSSKISPAGRSIIGLQLWWVSHLFEPILMFDLLSPSWINIWRFAGGEDDCSETGAYILHWWTFVSWEMDSGGFVVLHVSEFPLRFGVDQLCRTNLRILCSSSFVCLYTILWRLCILPELAAIREENAGNTLAALM